MQGTEKRIHEVKIRLTDSELLAATKAAIIEDRTITDFVHHGFGSYMFGYAYRIPESCLKGKEPNRD